MHIIDLSLVVREITSVTGNTVTLSDAPNNKVQFVDNAAYIFMDEFIGSDICNFNLLLNDLFGGEYIARFKPMSAGAPVLYQQLTPSVYKLVKPVKPCVWYIRSQKEIDSFEAMLGVL